MQREAELPGSTLHGHHSSETIEDQNARQERQQHGDETDAISTRGRQRIRMAGRFRVDAA
jgi:hypothetical protein